LILNDMLKPTHSIQLSIIIIIIIITNSAPPPVMSRLKDAFPAVDEFPTVLKWRRKPSVVSVSSTLPDLLGNSTSSLSPGDAAFKKEAPLDGEAPPGVVAVVVPAHLGQLGAWLYCCTGFRQRRSQARSPLTMERLEWGVSNARRRCACGFVKFWILLCSIPLRKSSCLCFASGYIFILLTPGTVNWRTRFIVEVRERVF